MKALTIALFTIIPSLAFSQSISQVRLNNFLNETKQLDQKMKIAHLAQCLATPERAGAQAQTGNLYNQCATDLCGAASQNKSIYSSDNSLEKHLPFFKRLKTKKLTDTIQKIYEIELAEKKAELEQIKDFVETPANFMDNIFFAHKIALARAIFLQHLDVKISPDAEFDKKVEVKINYPKGSSDSFKKALEEYAQETKNTFYLSYESIPLKNYTDADLKKVINLMKDQIELSVKQAKNITAHETKMINDVLNPLQNLEAVSREELENLYSLAFFLPNFLFSSPNIQLSFEPACKSDFCNEMYLDYLKSSEVKDKIAQYENVLKDPKTLTRAINSCKAAIYSNAVEEANSREAKKIFDIAIKDIKTNYVSQFSAESQAKIIDYLDNKLTVSAKNLKTLGGKGDAIGDFQNMADKYLENRKPSPHLEKDLTRSRFLTLNALFDQIDPLDGSHPCKSTSHTANSWDAYLAVTRIKEVASPKDVEMIERMIGKDDHVFLSDFTCNHPDHGKHIGAHEIGHALSNFFLTNKLSVSSAKRYNDARACVKDTQPKAPRAIAGMAITHPGDLSFTEEDMADAVAFQTYKNDDQIYSCLFLKPSLTTNTYIGLGFDAPEGAIHTHGFVRMLLEVTNKDVTLPESCTKLIDQVQPNIRFNKCI